MKSTVLVHSSCSNPMPQIGWLINNRYLLLTVLEAGSLSLGRPHGPVRAPFWVPDFSLCPHTAEGGKGALWSLFYIKGTNPIHEGSTLMS